MQRDATRATVAMAVVTLLGCGMNEVDTGGASESLVDCADGLSPDGRGCAPDGMIRWSAWSGDVFESAYQLIEGEVIVEGDISLGSVEEAYAEHAELSLDLDDLGSADKAFLDPRRSRKWPGGRIPYSLDPDLGCTVTMGVITGGPTDTNGNSRCLNLQGALDLWNARSADTGLVWEYRQSIGQRSPGRRFRHIDGGVSYSYVGYHRNRQAVRLSAGAALGTVAHEMGHSMGLIHEHQRLDRDEFLLVREELVADGFASQIATRRSGARNRRVRMVGRYDRDSLMHYGSSAFAIDQTLLSGYPDTPTLLSRGRLDRWGLRLPLSGGPDTLATIVDVGRTHERVEVGHTGIELADVSVARVDANAISDLVTRRGERYLWSPSAAGHWRWLTTSVGAYVAAGDEVFFGNFDSQAGRDVLVRAGARFRLYSSDGSVDTFAVDSAVDADVADVDGDGRDDLVYLDALGVVFWRSGADLTSPSEPWSTGARRLAVRVWRQPRDTLTATTLRLVEFLPGDVRAVVMERHVFAGPGPDPTPASQRLPGLLQLAQEADWAPVLASRRGSLPDYVQSLAQLHFLHLQSAVVDPARSIDLLTYAEDSPVAPDGSPVMLANCLQSAGALASVLYFATANSPMPGDMRSPGQIFEDEVGVAVDLRDALVGGFGPGGAPGLVSYGTVTECSEPSEADVHGLGTHYLRAGPSVLTGRQPGAPCAGSSLAQSVMVSAALDAYLEFEAAFVSASGLERARVTLARQEEGGWTVGSERTVPVRGKADFVTAEFTFGQPGLYRVEIAVEEPAPAAPTADHVATWIISVGGGAFCGNAIVEPGEACDLGGLNSDVLPDFCRTNCTLPTCGDGVEDSGEYCDDGAANHPDGPCRPDCGPVFD